MLLGRDLVVHSAACGATALTIAVLQTYINTHAHNNRERSTQVGDWVAATRKGSKSGQQVAFTGREGLGQSLAIHY